MKLPHGARDHTVSRLTTRSESDLQPDTLAVLDAVRVNGRLSEVYLQFANSEPALRAYLHMEQALRDGTLESREIEAVKLMVSERTACAYCLSVHSFKAKQAGLDANQQLLIRSGQPLGEARIDCLLSLARELMQTPGKLADDLLNEARRAGLTDANLVDLTLAISVILFTNLTNHINDSVSRLPPAPAMT
jgi:uncharacterized peroxidase-related enzyme